MRPARSLIASLLALALLIVAPVAQAAGPAKPPAGNYQCYKWSYVNGYSYWGGIKIISKSSYQSLQGSKQRGRYAAKAGKITFKSGPYKGVAAKTDRSTTGTPVIVLTLPKEQISVRCTKTS